MGAGASVGDGSSVDPWGGLSSDEALSRVKSEEGYSVISLDAEGFNDVLKEVPAGESLRIVAGDLDLDDDKISSVFTKAPSSLASKVTTLIVSGNNISSLNPLNSLVYLRGLAAGGNPLSSWEAPSVLSKCRFLVDLDLSYTYGLGVLLANNQAEASSSPPFAHLGATLLSLNLASCGISSLMISAGDPGVDGEAGSSRLLLGGLSSLLELTLAENELDDIDLVLSPNGLGPVASTLRELDCQENPMNEDEAEAVYKRRLLAASRPFDSDASTPDQEQFRFVRLERLDGKSIVTASTSQSLGEVTGGQCLGLDEKSSGILGDAPAMASLEKEVDAAMKGHHDTTVIA